MKVARAAPDTPSLGQGPIPKINKGASTILSKTLSTWTATAGLIIPVALRAELRATSGNCNISAGMNQNRYFLVNAAVAASALTAFPYQSRRRKAQRDSASPTSMDRTKD